MDSDSNKIDEFARLLAPIHSQLLGYVYAAVQNLEDSRDTLQQASLSAWRKFDDFDRDRSFSSWMYGFVRQEILAYHRDRARSRVSFSDELVQKLVHLEGDASETEHGGQSLRLDALRHCKGKLSPTDLELVEAFYVTGCRGQDLAKRRRRSPQSISNSLARIRKSLFACIKAQLVRGGIE